LSLEDEMLLFRLMSLREGNASRVPTALRQPLVDSTPQKIQNTRQAELDNLYPDDGQTSIAPLPHLAMSTSKKTAAVSSAAAGASTSTVPLPSLSTPGHDSGELTRMPSFQFANAGSPRNKKAEKKKSDASQVSSDTTTAQAASAGANPCGASNESTDCTSQHQQSSES